MAGEPDQETQFRQLRALGERQSANFNLLSDRTKVVEPRAVFRVWGVAVLLALLAGSMGSWMVVPFYYEAGDYSPSGAFGYSLWDIVGAPGESVTGQAAVVMVLLALVLALGMATLHVPGRARAVSCCVAAVLLIAAEIWLRIEIGHQLYSLSTDDSLTPGDGTTTNYRAFGGGTLTLSMLLTAAVALWAYDTSRRVHALRG
jgi:hypothetical protein